MDNVIVTPHMSGPTVAEEVTAPFLENMERFLAGEPLLKQVDLSRGSSGSLARHPDKANDAVKGRPRLRPFSPGNS